jgi:cytochrome c oxidase subunit 4
MSEHADTDTHHDHHPTPQQYVQVAVILAVLTAMEISASFIDIGPAFLPTLLILMAIKFVMVAGWFMHLRFDTRVFTRFMGGGLVLAASLYVVVLLTFSAKIDLP